MSVVERETVEVAVRPAPVKVTERDVLHRAADLLEEFGWCQHSLGGRGNGAFCALGALLQADFDFQGRGEVNPAGINTFASDAGYKAFKTASRRESLVGWNNRPTTTKAEVVARLRSAAEEATTA